jgi:GNAT superfamily N-acetyltransferase
MELTDGYLDVPAGKIASVVTFLQVLDPPPPRLEFVDPSWSLRRVTRPPLDWYRDLFHRIGDDWLWFSRLQLSDAALQAIIHDPMVDLHALAVDGRDEGLLELDFRVEGDCEVVFLGLTPRLIGRGAGRWLMNRALELAWTRPISRLWLHTCSLDHPDALSFYIRSGFVPYRRQVEVADDPRLAGQVPRDMAPQVPMI